MTPADEAHCRKCVWHIQGFGTRDVACGYSLRYGHQSRVKIHYDRIGMESLEGMTHGIGCTEFLEGNADLKKTLLSEDPSFISNQGWALLARERNEKRTHVKKASQTKMHCAENQPSGI